MSVAVIILAAGRGSRIGTPKAMLQLEGESFVARVARGSSELDLSPIIVVTGHRASEVAALVPGLPGVLVIENPAPERGQLSSLQVGLSGVPPDHSALDWPVDHPGVLLETVRLVLAEAAAHPGSVIVPTFGGRGGHPTLFPAALLGELAGLPDHEGARALLRRYPERVRRLAVADPAVARDVDTREDLARLTGLTAGPFDAAEHAAGLAALFDASGSDCFCRYWHFAGDKNAWLGRCAFERDLNRDELAAAARAASDEARGVVATTGDAVVGWAKVAPASALPRLYGQRFYRGLRCLTAAGGLREGVFTLGCVLVHPSHRGRGVAAALCRAAVEAARAWGAIALEAFPRVVEGRVSDEELWTGPHEALLREGLRPVEYRPPYPVLRIDFVR